MNKSLKKFSKKRLTLNESEQAIINPRIVDPYLKILGELSRVKANDNKLPKDISIHKIAIVGM